MLTEYGRLKTFADLTPEKITLFDEYLHKYRRNGKPYMQSNIYNYHKLVKAFCNDAVLFDKIERNPYSKLRFDKGEKQTIDFLTEEELDKISKVELPSMLLQHARDLFIFQTCTALSYSDLCKFDFALYDKIDGKYFRKGTRTKTGAVYASELLPPAVAMLNKYDNKLPVICNQKYNYALKLVALAAGINKPLHSHMARSTFATYALSHGASIESVSVMLGHTNITQTLKRYAEILPSTVLNDYKKLDGLLQ